MNPKAFQYSKTFLKIGNVARREDICRAWLDPYHHNELYKTTKQKNAFSVCFVLRKQVKVLDVKSNKLVQSPGPTHWKRRTGSCRLPSDLHLCTVARTCQHACTRIHTHTHTPNVKSLLML